jgi:hypothetical protein
MTFHSQTYPPVSSFASRLGMHSESGAGLSANSPGGAEFYQPVDIHRALNDIRQMPEFQTGKPNWLEEFWKRPEIHKFTHQMGDLLHQTLKALLGWLAHVQPPGLSHLPENIRWIFSVFVAFVLVLCALFGLYLFLGWLLKRRDKLSIPANANPQLSEQVQPLNSRHHTREAKRAADEARYELALQHLYMASLCLLDEHKIAPFEANRTNLEYLALLEKSKLTSTGVSSALAEQPKLPACFRMISNQFEAVRYGLQPLHAGQYAQSFSSYQALQSALEQPGVSNG